MGKSIFEFGEKFGYESPFGDWMKVIPVVLVKLAKIETTTKENKELYVVHFTVSSNIDLSNAKISLRTSNERTGALELSKEIQISKSKSLNEFTISLYKTSFNQHSSNSAPNPLIFYLQLEHSGLLSNPIVSESFEMKALEIRVSGLKITWANSDKKTKNANDLLTFSLTIRAINPKSKDVGIRMIQDFGSSVDEFLPARFLDGQSKENPPKLMPLTGELTSGKIGVYRKIIEERSKKGGQFYIQAYLDNEVQRTEPLNFEKEFSETLEASSSCGIEYRNKVSCTRRIGKSSTLYGPIYWGDLKMANYTGWNQLLAEGTITESDKKIIVAMSVNEGKLNSVQSYDSEVITAGAMQKTTKNSGLGEFSTQVFEFSQTHPEVYKAIFENCGWTVIKSSAGAKLYYKGVTGSELKKILRKGFDQSNFGKKVICPPIEPLISACENIDFQAKQVLDFIHRLPPYLEKHPTGKSYTIQEYIKSDLGKATVLDHSVNRPGHVVEYLSQALDKLFKTSPFNKNTQLKNPNNWGSNHKKYEQQLLDIYGPFRGMETTLSSGKKVPEEDAMTNANMRYEDLKEKLPIK